MSLTDTTPEAERVLAEVYRLMPPARKWRLVEGAYRSLRALHAAGVRLRSPDATPRQILADWIGRVLGCPHVPVAEEPVMDLSLLNISEARVVIRVLERLEIPYAVGGSMASSIHGTPRGTQDSDITVLPFLDKLDPFVSSFPSHFHIDPVSIRDAHARHASFNIIDTMTGFKSDLFVAAPGSFAQQALSRRQPVVLDDAPNEPLQVVTAEDIMLLKLQWYRLGNEVSDRQWNDVLGVIAAQRDRLDLPYLEHWATHLTVHDLLSRARRESGL
jgi:hypothetical protein